MVSDSNKHHVTVTRLVVVHTPADKVCPHREPATDLVATDCATAGLTMPNGEHALNGRVLTPLLKVPVARRA